MLWPMPAALPHGLLTHVPVWSSALQRPPPPRLQRWTILESRRRGHRGRERRGATAHRKPSPHPRNTAPAPLSDALHRCKLHIVQVASQILRCSMGWHPAPGPLEHSRRAQQRLVPAATVQSRLLEVPELWSVCHLPVPGPGSSEVEPRTRQAICKLGVKLLQQLAKCVHDSYWELWRGQARHAVFWLGLRLGGQAGQVQCMRGVPRREHDRSCCQLSDGYLTLHAGTKQHARGWKSSVGVRVRAHRLLCQLAHGPPPAGRPHAAHLCGHADCLAPEHLAWLSPQQNQACKVWHREHGRGPGRLWPEVGGVAAGGV